MNKLLLYLSFFCSSISFSQPNRTTLLNANKVAAKINSNGFLFHNNQAEVAGYEIPKGSGTHAIYTASIWVIGKDGNDTLRSAIMKYNNDSDFSTGPYSEFPNLQQNLDYLYQWEKQIWKVSKEQIAIHKLNFNNPNYVIPEDLLKWPGNGNVALGMAEQLAPYVDLNNDGIYSPQLGEYPLIKGDEAAFYFLNDFIPSNSTSTRKSLGIEVQVMAYQYKNTSSYLDSSTFLNFKIINRGTHSYDSLHVCLFADADIGNYADDFIGCDVNRNMMYFYNGDLNDESDGGKVGYGNYPPALGFISLNHTMKNNGYFISTATPLNAPSTALSPSDIINGVWGNGEKRYYGGLGYQGSIGVSNVETNYIFPGTSDDFGTLSTNGVNMSEQFPNGWDEITNQNPPGDRRGFIVNEPFKLHTNESHCSEYAILFARAREATLRSGITQLGKIADSCIVFFNSNNATSSCLETIKGDINIESNQNIILFPNPATNSIFIRATEELSNSYRIYNQMGIEIESGKLNGKETEIPLSSYSQGIYLLKVDGNYKPIKFIRL